LEFAALGVEHGYLTGMVFANPETILRVSMHPSGAFPGVRADIRLSRKFDSSSQNWRCRSLICPGVSLLLTGSVISGGIDSLLDDLSCPRYEPFSVDLIPDHTH
jgi:hypothetical protein